MRPVVVLVFFLPALIFFTSEANAQILQIERARINQDSTNYITGKAGLDFSLFNRNAGKDNPNNYLQLTFNGDIAYISAKHSYLLLNYFNYLLVNYDSEEQRNTVASTGYVHGRVNLWHKRKLSYELFTQVQTDKARGLNLRTLAGAGLRYKLLKTENTSLYAGSGLMHEHEEWDEPEQENVINTSDLLKSTNYLSVRAKLSEHLSTDAIAYYQTGYDEALGDFRNRVSGDVSLQVKLTGKFTFRVNFNCTFEDEPVVPVTNFVYAVTNGVQVRF